MTAPFMDGPRAVAEELIRDTYPPPAQNASAIQLPGTDNRPCRHADELGAVNSHDAAYTAGSSTCTSVPNAARSRTARSARTLRLRVIPRALSEAMNTL
jgi:hypothetical protein